MAISSSAFTPAAVAFLGTQRLEMGGVKNLYPEITVAKAYAVSNLTAVANDTVNFTGSTLALGDMAIVVIVANTAANHTTPAGWVSVAAANGTVDSGYMTVFSKTMVAGDLTSSVVFVLATPHTSEVVVLKAPAPPGTVGNFTCTAANQATVVLGATTVAQPTTGTVVGRVLTLVATNDGPTSFTFAYSAAGTGEPIQVLLPRTKAAGGPARVISIANAIAGPSNNNINIIANTAWLGAVAMDISVTFTIAINSTVVTNYSNNWKEIHPSVPFEVYAAELAMDIPNFQASAQFFGLELGFGPIGSVVGVAQHYKRFNSYATYGNYPETDGYRSFNCRIPVGSRVCVRPTTSLGSTTFGYFVNLVGA